MNARLPLLALWFAWVGPARGEGHLLLSAEGDVKLSVDGVGVTNLRGSDEVPVALSTGGSHRIDVKSYGGTLLCRKDLDVPDGAVLAVRWTEGALEVEKADPARFDAAVAAVAQRPPSATDPDTFRAAQAAASVAGVVFPGSPVISAVQGASTLVSAGSTIARTVGPVGGGGSSRGASGPVGRSEDHSLESLQKSGFDPYAASGGRPSFDASLCAVTFAVADGSGVQVAVDGQPVATLGAQHPSETVLLAPGLRTVLVSDAASGALLFRGRIAASAGLAFDLSLSTAAPPRPSLPGVWQ